MMNKIGKLFFLSVVFLITLSGCAESKKEAAADSNSLADQKIVFFGDSVTQNFEGEEKSYPNIVSQQTGAQTVNLGFGGTSMSVHPNASFDQFAFHSLTDAIIAADFSGQKQALEDPEVPAYFDQKLAELEEIDWNEVDIISIMYGANDWGTPLENSSDLMDISTFKGAGRASLDKLLTEYPHLQVLFIPMTYRFWPEYDNVDTDSSVNAQGLRPYQYTDAMIELANEFKFPYADTLYGLGINKYNRSLYFNGTDGTHPNELGTQKLGDRVAKTLLFYF